MMGYDDKSFQDLMRLYLVIHSVRRIDVVIVYARRGKLTMHASSFVRAQVYTLRTHHAQGVS